MNTKSFAKSLLTVSIVGILLLTTSACTDTSPTPVVSSAPSDTAKADLCSSNNDTSYGDAVAKEAVTDEHGTYCHVTISPKSSALEFNASVVDAASLEEFGFTNTDAEEIQKLGAAFIVEQSLDSTLLDTYTRERGIAWIDENENLINPNNIDLYRDYVEKNGLTAGVVLTDEGFPVLTRDGSPRANNYDIEVVKILAKTNEDGPFIQVVARTSVSYTAKNASIISYASSNTEKITEDTLRNDSPHVFENPEGESSIVIDGIFSVAYSKGNYEQFTGTTTEWNISAVNEK